MNKKIWYTIAGAGIVIFSIMVAGFLVANQEAPERNMDSEQVLYVKAQPVKNESHYSSVDYRGRVSSSENISLATEVVGKIEQGDVPFKSGQNFKKEQVMVRINDADAKAGMQSAVSSFLRSLSNILPDISVDFPDEYDKWKDFFNRIDVYGTLPELPKRNSEKEQIFLASNGILTEYYALKQREITLGKYELVAPFDGAFKRVNREIGAIASMGVELASVIRTDRLEIIAPVFPDDAKWIKVGDVVNISKGNEKVYSGKVSRLASFVDPTTQSINVYVAYKNIDNKILEGEFVDLVFNISKPVAGAELPRESLIDDNHVYVINGNNIERAEVEVVQLLDDKVIISGLNEQQLVVTESLVNVTPKTHVRPRI